MKRRTLAFLLSAALVAAGAFTWSTLSAARRVQWAAAALGKRHAEHERRASDHEQQLVRRPRARAESKAAAAAAPSPTTVEAATARVAPKPRPDAATLMTQNPELRALFERYAQSDLGLRYRPFYRAARLTPEQIVRFQALVIEEEQERMDLESAARASGLAEADLARLRTEQEQRHRAEQRQLPGEEAFGAYQEFQRIEPMQGFVGSVPIFAMDATESLTETQGERLLDVLAKASSPYQTGGKADGWKMNWPQAIGQMPGMLTPRQVKALQGRADLANVFVLADQYQSQLESGGP